MSNKSSGRQSGGSSEPNGPNQRAGNAAKSVGLSQSEQRELQRALEQRGENLSYQEIKEIATDIKKS